MSTEVTAAMMIGPTVPNSTHGQPSGDRRFFAPSHVLTLMEGHRAVWTVQECPSLGRPAPTRLIRPASPRNLLAAAVLGYTALVRPEVVEASDRLSDAVTPEPQGRGVRTQPIDDDLAAYVFDFCHEYTYGLITVLPESSIDGDELRMATAHDMQVAMSGCAVAP